jgi:hypothetical protein
MKDIKLVAIIVAAIVLGGAGVAYILTQPAQATAYCLVDVYGGTAQVSWNDASGTHTDSVNGGWSSTVKMNVGSTLTLSASKTTGSGELVISIYENDVLKSVARTNNTGTGITASTVL